MLILYAGLFTRFRKWGVYNWEFTIGNIVAVTTRPTARGVGTEGYRDGNFFPDHRSFSKVKFDIQEYIADLC